MLALLLAVLSVAHVGSARAACPQVLTDCFGAATAFTIVADKLIVGRGSLASEGFVTTLGSDIGDACADSALVSGPSCDETTGESLVVSEVDGIAATFAGFPCPSEGTPAGVGVHLFGDVVSGGGALRNLEAAIVDGIVDTTGTDGRVATCDQARADMHSAAATLSALAPTRDLGRITVVPGDDAFLTIQADPGVNVWTAERITLLSKKDGLSGEIHKTHLQIVLDPATESVVINVRKVKVGRYSRLFVSGDSGKVVVNVAPGGVVLNRAGSITPWVLAPDARVTIKTNGESDTGSLGVFAGRVGVFGGVVF